MEPRPEPLELNLLPDSERDVLVEFLEWHRAVLGKRAEGLTKAELNMTTASSDLTLGGLLKHMAVVEDNWFTERFAGKPEPEPWASAPWDDDRDWDFHSAADDTPEELFELFDLACERSRRVVAEARSLDAETALAHPETGKRWNLRWILVHMIEEYARHLGHADFLRESIDGQTG